MSVEMRLLTDNNAEEIADWCGGRTVTQHPLGENSTPVIGVNVPTRDSVERAQPGDYIARSHTGIFYVRKIYRPER